MKIDSFDIKILKILQHNSNISNVMLAEKLSLSPSATIRRVQALENKGVITNYSVDLDPQSVNSNLQVIIRVSLSGQSAKMLKSFESAIKLIEQVVVCYLIAGEYDYLVRLAVKDIAHYEYVHRNKLSKLPYVSSISSNFSLRKVVNRPIPINLGQEYA